MAMIQSQSGRIVERPMCYKPACPAQTPAQPEKKPPQSVHECIELCSSFLAERGCLTFRPHTTPEESAA